MRTKKNNTAKKSLYSIALLLAFNVTFSQVGISTPNPQGVFHIDAAKDNPATGTPNTAQEKNDITVTPVGNVGLGTTSPLARLDIHGETRFSDFSDGSLAWAIAPSPGGSTGSTSALEIIDRVHHVRRMVFNDNGNIYIGGSIFNNTGANGPAVSLIANNVGIGTNTPTSRLEVNSGVSNTSGLKLTNLTSSTPPSSGATLGVDATGNVVTVPGNAFTPVSGRVVLGSTVNIAADTANYNLISFTLPVAGTYLITYSIRGEIQVSGGSGFLVGFLSTAPSAGNVIPNTEILIITSSDGNRAVIGGTGTGSLVITVNGPTTYYAGIRSQSLPGVVFNNADGRTSVNYVKVTP